MADGNDLAAIENALGEARADTARPSLICVRTHIGYGSPVQDTREAHGEALGPANLRATKEKLGWPLEPMFLVPEEARAHFREALERGARWQKEWETLRDRFRADRPERAQQIEDQYVGKLPAGWDSGLPSFRPSDGPLATRDASQKVLTALGPKLPALLGGAADLSPSTKTLLPGFPDYSATDGLGRNFHFGVREHAMVSALNGMALHGGLLPYGGTFLVFSDYARGALRLAALQQTHAIFVFTHDSIGMGEDGPTHQPIEQLVSLRAIPDFFLFRPADANETTAVWRLAVQRPGPTALVFTRQKVSVLDPARYPIAEGVPRGGYVLSEAPAVRRRSSSSRPVRRSPSPSMRRRSSATSVWRRGSCLCRAGASLTSNRRSTATRSSPPALPRSPSKRGRPSGGRGTSVPAGRRWGSTISVPRLPGRCFSGSSASPQTTSSK